MNEKEYMLELEEQCTKLRKDLYAALEYGEALATFREGTPSATRAEKDLEKLVMKYKYGKRLGKE